MAVLDQDARRTTAVTCTGVQTPPRAVAMPRALSALAMARNDVAPLAFICSMTGSTLAAKRSAFALLEAITRRCASLSFGPPVTSGCGAAQVNARAEHYRRLAFLDTDYYARNHSV